MLDDVHGCIDYDESGHGPTVVLVPGSCSTGAAWRPVIAGWDGAFRTVTTSLLGYGGTAERRTAQDASIEYEADVVEAVVAQASNGAGSKVHLVGHSYGAAAALAFALRDPSTVASLTLIEMPPPTLLRDVGEHDHFKSFRRMTAVYEADFALGKPDAISTMIDFYGGAGTWQSWPQRVRDYAMRTTAVNLVDWVTAYELAWDFDAMRRLGLPTLVVYGRRSPPAMRTGGLALAKCLGVPLQMVDGAAHFMIATHAAEVARLIAGHVRRAEGAASGAAFATLSLS